MRKMTYLAAAIMMAALLAGCGDTHDSVMGDSVTEMKAFATVLESIKDEATAKEAAPKLEAIGARMKDLKARMDKLGKPSEADEKAMMTKYQKEIEEVQGKMMGAAFKLMANPEAAKHIEKAMNDIKGSM